MSAYSAATASKTLHIIILFQARISIDLKIDCFLNCILAVTEMMINYPHL